MKLKIIIGLILLTSMILGCSTGCHTTEELVELSDMWHEREDRMQNRVSELIEDFNITIPTCKVGGELQKWCIGSAFGVPNSTVYYCNNHPSGWQCTSVTELKQIPNGDKK